MDSLKLFIALLFLSVSFSCQLKKEAPTSNTLDQMQWLIGSWKNHSDKMDLYESWRKNNDSTYIGVSYIVVNSDTVSSENITLIQKGKDIFYEPTVHNQNEGESIPFKMTAISSQEATFENPEHDFPQKIKYIQITEDSLVAEISGNINGKMQSRTFEMYRKK